MVWAIISSVRPWIKPHQCTKFDESLSKIYLCWTQENKTDRWIDKLKIILSIHWCKKRAVNLNSFWSTSGVGYKYMLSNVMVLLFIWLIMVIIIRKCLKKLLLSFTQRREICDAAFMQTSQKPNHFTWKQIKVYTWEHNKRLLLLYINKIIRFIFSL